MKNKQKVDMCVALCLILIGVILLMLPLFNVTNIKWLMTGIFSLYTILNCIQFLLTKNSKDYEGLYTSLASLLVLAINLIFDISENPKHIAMLLMLWISLMSVIKLKKADYYHDRHDRMWKMRAFNLGLFILTGILASINLSYDNSVQVLVIGFFMLIHGILELFDPLTKTLISHS